jgi:hypothetical protein
VIVNAPDHVLVDHINESGEGDYGLNNRKSNLRLASQSQNLHNSAPYKNNKSGYRGVHYMRPPRKRWVCSIAVNGKSRHLGRFMTAEEAARAYDKAAVELMGEFASLNFPGEHTD